MGWRNTAGIPHFHQAHGEKRALNHNTTILQWTVAKYLHFHLKTSCPAAGEPKLLHLFVNIPQFSNLKVITLVRKGE